MLDAMADRGREARRTGLDTRSLERARSKRLQIPKSSATCLVAAALLGACSHVATGDASDAGDPGKRTEPPVGARHNSMEESLEACVKRARDLTNGKARVGAMDTRQITSGTHPRGGWSCVLQANGQYKLNVGWYR